MCPNDGHCSRYLHQMGCRGEGCRTVANDYKREYRASKRSGREQRPIPPVPFDPTTAACAGHDSNTFYEEFTPATVAQAKALCAQCDHRAACLAHAIEHREPAGVWGGLTTKERRRAARRRAT
jgi:WhiB family redox-sensing transcriptional regulator